MNFFLKFHLFCAAENMTMKISSEYCRSVSIEIPNKLMGRNNDGNRSKIDHLFFFEKNSLIKGDIKNSTLKLSGTIFVRDKITK